MNRRDFYYRQLVTQAEMDAAFGDAEDAFKAFAVNQTIGGGALYGTLGVLWGLDVSEAAPPDLTVEVAVGRARNKGDGEYISNTTPASSVDVSQDKLGATTTVAAPGNERWLSVFVIPQDAASDPRVDGNGIPLWWVLAKNRAFEVEQAAELPLGTGTKPALRADAVLLCDIQRTFGDATIDNAEISTTRREYYLTQEMAYHLQNFGTKHLAAQIDDDSAAGGYHGASVQDTIDLLATGLTAHENGGASKHDATEVDDETGGGYHGATAQATLDALNTGLVAHENGGASKHDASELDDETQVQDVQTTLDQLYARGNVVAWGVTYWTGAAIRWAETGAAVDIRSGPWDITKGNTGGDDDLAIERNGVGDYLLYVTVTSIQRIVVQVSGSSNQSVWPVESQLNRGGVSGKEVRILLYNDVGALVDAGFNISIWEVP